MYLSNGVQPIAKDLRVVDGNRKKGSASLPRFQMSFLTVFINSELS